MALRHVERTSLFSNKTSWRWWRQYLALQRPSSVCQLGTSDCRADRWLSHMGRVRFHTRNQCLAWNNFMCLIQIWWFFFVVVHSWNTVSSLLESSEDLAFQCITANPGARIATGSKQLLLFLTVWRLNGFLSSSSFVTCVNWLTRSSLLPELLVSCLRSQQTQTSSQKCF